MDLDLCLPCPTNDSFRLISVVGRQFAMCPHDLGHRLDLLWIACRVRSNFCRLAARVPGSFQISADLLTTRTRCVEILLRVSLDLRCPTSAGRNLVTEPTQVIGQLRLVDRRRKLLGSEKSMGLNSASLAVLSYGQIENDGVGMKLRSNITIDRTCRIVFEGCGKKFPGCLGQMIASDPCLCVALQFLERYFTASRWASRTRESPPTRAVRETDFGAEKVASQPALCSMVLI